MSGATEQLLRSYCSRRREILGRLNDFKKVWLEGDDTDIFTELAFCLLTPQSKAKVCWKAITGCCERDLLLKGNMRQVRAMLVGVRFRNNKARYIVEARRLFTKDGKLSVRKIIGQFKEPYDTREWLVENVTGFGYKEASHSLRNIGLGENLAILDRHILKNLKTLGVIDEVPRTLTKKKYLDIEQRMTEFSESAGIPMAHLDLLLWCKETGEVFK